MPYKATNVGYESNAYIEELLAKIGREHALCGVRPLAPIVDLKIAKALSSAKILP